MNTNLIHNILNLIGLVVGVLVTFDWAQLGLSPEAAATVAGAALLAQNVVKFAINLVRDGFYGLVKHQPPVT